MIFYDNTTLSNGFVQQCWLAYKGNNKWPSSGDKYNRILMVANRKLSELAEDGNKNWKFLWSDQTIDTIEADTQSYNLPAAAVDLSDSVYIYDTSGNLVAEVPVVSPQERMKYNRAVYVSSTNPLVLTFTETIDSSHPWVGFTVKASLYSYWSALSATTDKLPSQAASWLIYEVAGELARGDPARAFQFGNLQGIANDKYEKMIALNENGGFNQPNRAHVRMPNMVTPQR